MKKISVVILNYCVAELAIKSVLSVKRSTYKNIEIIVVDNNSGDDIGERLKDFPEVDFIQSKDNSGYSGGNNLGIKKALLNGADYIFILNSDATVESEAIASLVEAAEEGVGDLLGPKILFPESKSIWYAGGIFDRNNVLGKHRGVDEKDEGQYDKIEETDYVTGAALFVKAQVFEKIGLLDEKYFLYYEDSDFCFRAKSAGFKVSYVPKALVYHANAKSTGLGSPVQDYYITRNRMLFASKFLTLRTRFALLREGVKNIGNPVRRKALIDFLTGKFGKGDI